jgi:hypothetical protein
LHGAADHIPIAGGADVFLPGVGAHNDQIDVFFARNSQNFPGRDSDGSFNFNTLGVFQQITVGIFHLFFHPLDIIGIRLLHFTGSDIGDKWAVAPGGDAEHMKKGELGLPLQFQIKGHFGCIVACG